MQATISLSWMSSRMRASHSAPTKRAHRLLRTGWLQPSERFGCFRHHLRLGELSAYCDHAGSCTEFVPVAHIVDYPGGDAQKDHGIMRHTLDTGDFGMFHEMAEHASCDTTVLLRALVMDVTHQYNTVH